MGGGEEGGSMEGDGEGHDYGDVQAEEEGGGAHEGEEEAEVQPTEEAEQYGDEAGERGAGRAWVLSTGRMAGGVGLACSCWPGSSTRERDACHAAAGASM